MKRVFVTGISTDVGKTLVSAILAEALQADYWKPVQAGDLAHTDSHTVAGLVCNSKTRIHKSSYALHAAMSPHASAALEGIRIARDSIREPETENHLVIEGAGGLLVPLNESASMLDLILPHYTVVLVSRHYLGSINHSLLTAERLRREGLKTVLVFNGDLQPSTEDLILRQTGLPLLGRIYDEAHINREIISEYARKFRPALGLL